MNLLPYQYKTRGMSYTDFVGEYLYDEPQGFAYIDPSGGLVDDLSDVISGAMAAGLWVFDHIVDKKYTLREIEAGISWLEAQGYTVGRYIHRKKMIYRLKITCDYNNGMFKFDS